MCSPWAPAPPVRLTLYTHWQPCGLLARYTDIHNNTLIMHKKIHEDGDAGCYFHIKCGKKTKDIAMHLY